MQYFLVLLVVSSANILNGSDANNTPAVAVSKLKTTTHQGVTRMKLITNDAIVSMHDTSTFIVHTVTDSNVTYENELLALLTHLKMFIFVYQWLLTPFIILLNLTSIVLCIRSHNHALRTRANDFVLSLAIADLMVGLYMPCFSAVYFFPSLSLNYLYCNFRNFLQLAHVMASILSILLITIDRYVAIIYPLTYYKTGSLPCSRLLIAVIWIFSIFSTMTIMFWNKGVNFGCTFIGTIYSTTFYIIWCVPFFSLCLTMTIIYMRIFYVAAQHQQRETKMSEGVQQQRNQPNDQRIKRDRKYSKVSTCVHYFYVLDCYSLLLLFCLPMLFSLLLLLL